MYSLIRQIDRKRFLLIGKGSHVKSLAYVDNVVAATMFLWGLSHNAFPEPPLGRHEIFNYVDKPDLSVVGIVDAIYCALHRTRLIIHIPLWLGLVVAIPFDLVIAVTGRNLPISSSRIRKLATATAFNADKVQAAGFQARVSLMDGIARMVEWYGTAKDDAMTGSDSGG